MPVSVVISARNAGSQIVPSLRSILRALGPDDEIVALDDGSHDDTHSLMRAVLTDARHTLLQTGGLGLTSALRLGLQAAHGELIARLDAGDTMTPDRLELQRAAFRDDPSLVACGGNVRFVSENGDILGTSRFPTRDLGIRACLLALSSSFVHSALCLRRSAVAAAGGYRERFTYAQDFDLLLRLSRVGRLRNLRGIVGDYLISPNGISATRTIEQYEFARAAWKSHLRSILGAPERDVVRESLGSWHTLRLQAIRQLRERAMVARQNRDLSQAHLLELALRCCTPLRSTVGAAVRGCELMLDAATRSWN